MAPKHRNRVGPPRPARSIIAAVALIVGLLTPAAEARIVVDPEGPAGKQYSGQLDRAREEASGRDGDAGVPGSTATAQPFGEGIRSGTGAESPGGPSDRVSGTPADSLGPTDEGGAALRLAGLSLAVLALGALLALAARLGTRWISV